MSELTPEEKHAIEQRHPWATFVIIMLMFAGFAWGWLYLWDMFISYGKIN